MRIIIFLLLSFSLQAQFTLTCYDNEKIASCRGCGIPGQYLTGLMIRNNQNGSDVAFHHPVILSIVGTNVTFRDAFNAKTTINVSQIQTHNTITKLVNFIGECKGTATSNISFANVTGLQDSLNGKANKGNDAGKIRISNDTIYYKSSIDSLEKIIKIPNNGSGLDSLFGTYGDKVRMATAIIRPSWNETTNTVTWLFINDTDHDVIFFNALTTPNNSILRIGFPTVKKVLGFQATNDEVTDFHFSFTGHKQFAEYLENIINKKIL